MSFQGNTMLSICIPVYNVNVTNLVTELHRQGLESGVAFEICLLDDASGMAFYEFNRPLEVFPEVKYRELPENMGRSRARNQLAKDAAYDHLLFMDCDMEIIGRDFIRQYLQQIPKHRVACGGHVYGPKPHANNLFLHWKAGTQRESKPAKQRKTRPHHHFMTGNFCIERKLILHIGFDESLKGYGHEDSLLGFELQKRGIHVEHFDNPLLHTGLVEAPEYLDKTQQAMKNLAQIHQNSPRAREFASMVAVLKTALILQSMRCKSLTAGLLGAFSPLMKRNLLGSNPNLRILDLYKLELLCKNLP